MAGRRAEQLEVDAARVETKLGERGTGFAHERSGAAKVGVGVLRQFERSEDGWGEAAGAVEVSAFDVVRTAAG